MRAVAFSDLHRDTNAAKRITTTEADIYLCAGDITDFGRGIEEMVDALQGVLDKLYIVPGNNETPDLLAQCFPNVVHGKKAEVGGLTVGGVGGSTPTPFNTPFELTDEEIREVLERVGPVDVLVAHCPPVGTSLALTSSGMDVGSVALREYIEDYQPAIAIVGHIHEKAGTEERIGKTRVVNPGKGMVLHV